MVSALPPVDLKPPKHLTKEARARWIDLAPELAACDLLSQVDRDLLAQYCECYALWLLAKKDSHGKEVLISPRTQAEYPNPMINIALGAGDRMSKIAAAFGMSPSARSSLNRAGPTDGDPLGDWMNRHDGPRPTKKTNKTKKKAAKKKKRAKRG